MQENIVGDRCGVGSATLTKHMIAAHLHDNMGLAKSITENLVSQLFQEMSAILKNGDAIKIPGFGTFSISQKKERPGMNLHTNQKMTISSREVIRFVPSRILKNRINGVR